jgi:uroporphyrinogen decarboxylase
MRQAGRYLPEYRELRARHSFTRLYREPELASEVTLQPIRRFGLDAAIVFSDILVLPEAMGIPLDFPEGGPVLGRTVRAREEVESLRRVEPEEDLAFVADALRLLRRELGDETALVGFSGAPYTLASYMIEGRGSHSFESARRMEYREPELLDALLDRLTDAIADYLVMQVRCGVDAVQLFDSWGGNLTPEGYARLAAPRAKRIVDAVHAAGGRIIHFVLGAAGFLEQLRGAGADVVGIDWHQPLGDAIRRLGPGQAVQGNLDPLALQAPAAQVRRTTRRIVEAGRSAAGHVFNVGHGLVPSTPIAGVEAVLDEIRS